MEVRQLLIRDNLRASDLIELLREVGGVPIDELKSAGAVGGLVGERQPDDGRSEVCSGQ